MTFNIMEDYFHLALNFFKKKFNACCYAILLDTN